MDKLLITCDISIKQAMQQMDRIGEKTLFVVNERRELLGALTDGDIRRWILSQGDLKESVEKIFNKNPKFVMETTSHEELKSSILKERIESMPVLNQQRRVCRILQWKDILGQTVVMPRTKIRIPVVIMAGGEGRRLDPFTRILPKPLIPIGEKPIIRIIMDGFWEYGVRHFYVSISHKSRMIKAYFQDLDTFRNITFIEEKKPLGTAGCLRLLENKIKGPLLVTNCDIIIRANFEEIIRFHRRNSNSITIVGSWRHFTVPYGVCSIENGGRLTAITEKPEHDFLVNTGMYVLDASILKLIPKRTLYPMTDLINAAKEAGGKVAVFPLSEKSWIDVGQWGEYQKAIKDFVINK